MVSSSSLKLPLIGRDMATAQLRMRTDNTPPAELDVKDKPGEGL
jgi:hypothetical protein